MLIKIIAKMKGKKFTKLKTEIFTDILCIVIIDLRPKQMLFQMVA